MDIGSSRKAEKPLQASISEIPPRQPLVAGQADYKSKKTKAQADTFNSEKGDPATSLFEKSLQRLSWLNSAQKRLAASRWKTASEKNVPYAYAMQKIGGRDYVLDAHSAWEEISESDNTGKLYNLENKYWSPAANETSFFCAVPGSAENFRLGTMNQLKETGLNPHLLSLLLTANSIEDEDFETQHEKDYYVYESKSLYAALLSTGTILPRDLILARKVAESSDPEMFHDATLKLMTYSAGHDMFFLDLGLKMGINPDEKSKETGCRPMTWAIIKGNHAAVQKLLPFTADPGADREFLLDLGSGPRDPNLLDWALSYKTRSGTSR